MVKFIQVDPGEIDNTREGHRGRVSYPIIKGFLETGFYVSELDMTGVQQKPSLLCMLLRQYALTHHHPVKPFMRGGKVYLMRLDIDANGDTIPDWEEKLLRQRIGNQVPKEITSDEVAKRFNEEKGKSTK